MKLTKEDYSRSAQETMLARVQLGFMALGLIAVGVWLYFWPLYAIVALSLPAVALIWWQAAYCAEACIFATCLVWGAWKADGISRWLLIPRFWMHVVWSRSITGKNWYHTERVTFTNGTWYPYLNYVPNDAASRPRPAEEDQQGEP